MDPRALRADIERYHKAFALPDGWRVCLAIEKKYGLDGLPPHMVSEDLAGMLEELEDKLKRRGVPLT